MGDPLLGPTGIDAVVHGNVLINPVYREAKKRYYHSQHPIIEEWMDKDYVCDIHMEVFPYFPFSFTFLSPFSFTFPL